MSERDPPTSRFQRVKPEHLGVGGLALALLMGGGGGWVGLTGAARVDGVAGKVDAISQKIDDRFADLGRRLEKMEQHDDERARAAERLAAELARLSTRLDEHDRRLEKLEGGKR